MFGLISSINTAKDFQDVKNSFLVKCIFHSVCHLSIILWQSQLRNLVTNHKSLNESSNTSKWEFFFLSIQIQSKAAHFIILNKVKKLHLEFVLFPTTFCISFLLKCKLL